MRPRVFISSVMVDFEAIREAAAAGVADAGADPVMVEQLPALSVSPRNACLDGVRSADVYLFIVGKRAGWVAPSSTPVTEEEYDEAVVCGLQVLAFIQDVDDREPAATRLIRKVSDYVSGQFRSTFTTPDDLRAKVRDSVQTAKSGVTLPRASPRRASELIAALDRGGHAPSLALALAPEPRYEVIPPQVLDSAEFIEDLLELGHARPIRLFQYSQATEAERPVAGSVRVSQDAHGAMSAGLLVSDAGELTLTRSVAPKDDDRLLFGTLIEADVEHTLRSEFAFARALFEKLDPYERCSTLWMCCAIDGAANRYLYREVPRGNSAPVRMGEERILAEPPKLVPRAVLRKPDETIKRLLALFRRHLGRGQ